MTLNITLVAPWASYQSSDFRLSTWTGASYREMDVLGHKQLSVLGKAWFASVAFTGIAQAPGGLHVDKWLAELAHELGVFGTFDSLLDGLCRADEWLVRIPLANRRLTFTVVAYLGSRLEVAIVSNFQNGRGQMYEVTEALNIHRYRPTQVQVFVTGMSDAVSRADIKLLRSSLRARKSLQVVLETMARVNFRSSARPEARNTISSACLVTSLRPTGRMISHAFGLDPTKRYIPPINAVPFGSLKDFDLEAIAREEGIAGPLRLVETHTVMGYATPEADPDEATDFT